jgi:hypothetical protein
MDLDIIGNKQVIGIRMDESTVYIPIDLVCETRHDDGCKIVRNVLGRHGDDWAFVGFDGHVREDALCTGPFPVIFRGVGHIFFDRGQGVVVVGAEEIDGTFKREDGAHGSQGSGEGWNNRTIVEAAGENARIEEGVVEGFLIVGERSFFVGLDVFFPNGGHGFGVPIKVCDDAVDVVDQDICVAPNSVELVGLGVEIGELLLANGTPQKST